MISLDTPSKQRDVELRTIKADKAKSVFVFPKLLHGTCYIAAEGLAWCELGVTTLHYHRIMICTTSRVILPLPVELKHQTVPVPYYH